MPCTHALSLVLTCCIPTALHAQIGTDWDEEATRALIDRGRIDQAMEACDAAIANVFQQGFDQDKPLMDGIEASEIKLGILEAMDASVDQRLECLETWSEFQANAEWQGVIDLDGYPDFKFGPEWIQWRSGSYMANLGRSLIATGDLGAIQDGQRLIRDAALALAEVARLRVDRRPDHPDLPVLVHDANAMIKEYIAYDTRGVDTDILRATREDLISIVNQIASLGLLDLWTDEADGFSSSDASLGGLVGSRLSDQPVDEFIVTSLTTWLDAVPAETWRRGPGWGVLNAARDTLQLALQSDQPIPGVDRLAEALVRILQMTPRASQEYIATNQFNLVSALVQAGRLDEAETMFESLPPSSSEWVSFYRRGAGRALKNAGRLATPKAESPAEQDAEPTEVPVTEAEPPIAVMDSAGDDVTSSTDIVPTPSQANQPEGNLLVRPRRIDWGTLAVIGTASVMTLAPFALRIFRRQTSL
ncbi:MAG: hypothetical protein RLZZ461_40 [Planctomycetota bacterium]|jgi:hypothetical protein